MRNSVWRLAGVFAIVVLAATACGGGSSTSSGGQGESGSPSVGSESSSPSTGGGSPGGGGNATTISVASNLNSGVLPLWVGIEKGIFKKNGLTIKWTNISNIGTIPPQLGKTFDIGLVTPTGAIQSTSQGIPVTEVAGTYIDTKSNPGSFLMVAKDSGITKVSQLEGKTIGALTVAGTLNYATLKMLKQAGVSPNSVKVIEVNGPQHQAQLQSGRIDAVETVFPFVLKIKDAGGKSLGHPFRSIGMPLSTIWWGANPSWAKSHADVIKEFRKGLETSVKFIKNNDSEARSILRKYTKLPKSVAMRYRMHHYTAEVRPQDIPKWVNVLKEFAGFRGQVEASKLTFQPEG